MRAHICCVTSLVLACVSGDALGAQACLRKEPLTKNAADYAEEGGVGGFIDWLIKLSGPGFVSTGYSVAIPVSCGNRIVRVEPSISGGVSVASDKKIEPDATITLVTGQVAVILLPRSIPFNLGVGMALHRFGGDVDAFYHPSFIPLQVDYRPPIGTSHFLPRIGAAVHLFSAFSQSDFAPLSVTVHRNRTEATLVLKISADYR
jgi:hypothetical protein